MTPANINPPPILAATDDVDDPPPNNSPPTSNNHPTPRPSPPSPPFLAVPAVDDTGRIIPTFSSLNNASNGTQVSLTTYLVTLSNYNPTLDHHPSWLQGHSPPAPRY